MQAADIVVAEAQLNREGELELASAKMTLAASWGAMTPDFGEVVGDLQTLPTVAPFETLATRLPMTPGTVGFLPLRDLSAPGAYTLAEAEAKPNIDAVSLGVRRLKPSGSRRGDVDLGAVIARRALDTRCPRQMRSLLRWRRGVTPNASSANRPCSTSIRTHARANRG